MGDLPASPSAINSWSPEYLESLYQQWLDDPESVASDWQHFFQGFHLGTSRPPGEGGEESTAAPREPEGRHVDEHLVKQARVWSLIYHYRDIGHLMADTDPLGQKRPRPENLKLEAFQLSEADFEEEFFTPIPAFDRPVKLREIIDYLETIYCGHVGAEYIHIQNTDERRWIQDKLERPSSQVSLSADDKQNLLRKLHQAEVFESFLHSRYRGQKRFSLEGSETLIPLLWYLLESAAESGVIESVLGMAHRGRLNVLANIINKAYDDIFAEFEDNYEDAYEGGGDVKYHKGYSSNFMTSKGKLLYLHLAANPSHLEAVNSVVEGRCRAKQRLTGDSERNRVVPLLIHGDAAFAGQGMVAETLQMVKLPGYTTGGTVHIIVNNQIGFTTDPLAARSSVYCTDVAKMVQAPIFHVNAEDVDACARLAHLAMEYRQRFKKDVIIDMWCYRKHGHNEGDEPAFTQPGMYKIIREKKPIREIYGEQLKEEGVVHTDEIDRMRKDLEEILDTAQKHGKETPTSRNQAAFAKNWTGFRGSYSHETVDTTVHSEVLKMIAERAATTPKEFTPHRKVKRLYDKRLEAIQKNEPRDWGAARMLPYGPLPHEGPGVRLTGQDPRRGTFSHRHGVLTDTKTHEEYTPLDHISENQARFCIYDSPLSEAAVLGFEYGYTLSAPDMLILWEAQFGDFVNGAQVIIDQFIASAEAKWDRYSGLVLLLPHGYEGQGPEHSSARLERFLQLCADDNLQVANCTTPAQFFHLIRRQIKRKFRKPLIVMTPKSLLRRPEARSTLEELSNGSFQEIIDDPTVHDRSVIKRLLLCSGKVYYDLVARQEELGDTDTAIIRIEQLYPLNTKMISQVLARYPEGSESFWVQEEPKNMGAWMFMSDAFVETLNIRLRYIGRQASATPAVGSPTVHEQELRELLESALPASARVAAAS